MYQDFSGHAKVFKAFCDENRLAILHMLKNGERCACKILEDIPVSQSTLSHHMKILCESGLVTGRQEGKWTHYSLCIDSCERAAQLIGAYTVAGSPQEAEEACQCR